MKRCLLDSSFVIDLLNEVAANRRGPAHAWVARNSGADLWVSPVTYAEVLEGAEDAAAVRLHFPPKPHRAGYFNIARLPPPSNRSAAVFCRKSPLEKCDDHTTSIPSSKKHTAG